MKYDKSSSQGKEAGIKKGQISNYTQNRGVTQHPSTWSYFTELT